MTVSSFISLARPRHWLKNIFVLMPVPFAVADGAALNSLDFLTGLLGFCFANSAIYVINDIIDRERDSKHPRNRMRPVASGEIKPALAFAFAFGLIVIATFMMILATSQAALIIMFAYVLLNLFYSLKARHIPLLDVFILSSGYVLRVLLGCALLGVNASNWLLLISSGLALFLSMGKRFADIQSGSGNEYRPSLRGYSLRYLEQVLSITAAITLIAYALYCREAAVLIDGREFYSLPFVVYGMLEYLRICSLEKKGDSPVDLLLTSPAILICGICWFIASLWSLGIL